MTTPQKAKNKIKYCECDCGGSPANSKANYIRGHRPRMSLEQRLFAHVDKTESCWLWTGSITNSGYGDLGRTPYDKGWFAHRLSWTIHNGTIPDGLKVLHKCDVRICVNPDHLFIGTHQDNMDDMDAKGRRISLRGENSPVHKLTDEQVREIRLRYSGVPYNNNARELANEFGVTWQYIQQLIRKEWRKSV